MKDEVAYRFLELGWPLISGFRPGAFILIDQTSEE
jgi:hypothetical protein